MLCLWCDWLGCSLLLSKHRVQEASCMRVQTTYTAPTQCVGWSSSCRFCCLDALISHPTTTYVRAAATSLRLSPATCCTVAGAVLCCGKLPGLRPNENHGSALLRPCCVLLSRAHAQHRMPACYTVVVGNTSTSPLHKPAIKSRKHVP